MMTAMLQLLDEALHLVNSGHCESSLLLFEDRRNLENLQADGQGQEPLSRNWPKSLPVQRTPRLESMLDVMMSYRPLPRMRAKRPSKRWIRSSFGKANYSADGYAAVASIRNGWGSGTWMRKLFSLT